MQAFHRVERLFDVPPQAFDPPPRVDSSVMRMRPRAEPLVRDAATLEGLLAVAFNQRRKMLRGTLLPWLRTQGLDPSEPAFALEPTARPEEIPVEGWARLADALLDARAARPQPPDGEP
jgi:16S rRNA (adenine1518-N6/adenine1519-N6)-dimethyltransferase